MGRHPAGLSAGAGEDLLTAWQPAFAGKMDAKYKDAAGPLVR